ncbi:B12-binding domain-containing radical SAM protein [Sphingomonas sp. GlSt437]|uniref:B12-binding domain-containing radical SAM protein n=2 Tax=Bacteria TaxID=2 RepID=UPI003A84495C
MGERFQVYLIKPTRYDDEGYPLQWWRSMIPSNSLACMVGIVEDAFERGVLADVPRDMHIIDEINTKLSVDKIIRNIRDNGGRAFIGLVGVQSNQFPHALDLAKQFRAAGLPVCIGGFHVSGCISMLKTLPPEFAEMEALGISVFAGEAEEARIDDVLLDAYSGKLKPVYNYLKDTPGIAGAPVPHLPREHVTKNFAKYASFDLGRGCPFECSFCTIINVQGRKSRFRTPEDLERIVKANAEQGISQFFLTDDNFARNKNWEAFIDRLIELKEEGFPVRLVIQVDVLAHRVPRFMEKVVAAGADQVFIGLENINADNLEAANKRQNRVEDYRAMFLAWKQYPVVITCGYIIGFPNDTYDAIMRDIEILKNELAIDTLYMNYLTPLPGSEDHRKLYEAGVWMDPDLNKYDLNHRVTHHPRMADDEWERAYRDAHRSFYSWEHMERVLKRLVALGSNRRLTTMHRLIAYREAVRLEGVAKLESGWIRIKRRRNRRPGLPIENPLVFYPRYLAHVAWSVSITIHTWWKLRRILKRIMNDPNRLAYRDLAITPVEAPNDSHLLSDTRSTPIADKRRAQAQAA